MDNLCTLFKGIDEQIPANLNNSEYINKISLSLNNFCPLVDGENDQKCNNYEEIVISAFITLVFHLKNEVENDKLVKYGILWLCYKLNQKTENTIDNLDEIYNKYIKGIEEYVKGSGDHETYNSCKDIINKKIYLKTIGIKEMSKIYEALKILCKLYTGCNDKETNYANYSQDAQDFANNFENLNQDSSIIGNNSYREILSNLFNDYDYFKNSCAKNCRYCSDIPTLPDINLPKTYVQDQVESSGVTSPNSSIAKILIPPLLIFAIPIFLGIAYKYSLFGFDKRLQGKHLREKLKKIKKKMNDYI
ncbi:Plasmodium variant antigen protein Cir/Yir/Bir, putative [Plasmodium chabaudi adami]|uniref:Plasmodium variant antigen protein Cir/Yir/Bir, putative n=1 Tax=Plasmodium chabaudi adami TaxID=5826 RepID=A0A1D3LCZ4_PLACE|nr:Plasmodium variant antigen protein Cir/Yir/Bir, putative [Plasmodium chabaudi adami]